MAGLGVAAGIDFGTSNSAATVAWADRLLEVELEPGSQPPALMPSLLYHQEESGWSVGEAARSAYQDSSEGRFIQSIKRFLPSPSFESTLIGGKRYRIEHLIGLFLREVRARLSLAAGESISRVVLGRPARFHSDPGREALAVGRLQRAAELAGFSDCTFCREPVAAAHAYERTLDRDILCLVGDLGGGTSDFTLMKLGPRRRDSRDRTTDVVGVSGVNVGGNDMDAALVRVAVYPQLGYRSHYRRLEQRETIPTDLHQKLQRWSELSFACTRKNARRIESWIRSAEDAPGLQMLLAVYQWNLGFELSRAVEAAKVALSTAEETVLRVHSPMGLDLEHEVSRHSFEQEIASELATIGRCIDELLMSTGVEASAVDTVFLTGGTSNIPAVRALFETRLPGRVLSGRELLDVGYGLGLRAQHGLAGGDTSRPWE